MCMSPLTGLWVDEKMGAVNMPPLRGSPYSLLTAYCLLSHNPAMSHLRTTSLTRFVTLSLTLLKYSSAFFWSNFG